MCFIDNMIRQGGGQVRCPECDSVILDHRICPTCIANARKPKNERPLPKARKSK